jgi:3-hydroxyacyl-CoA dehydrogenase
VSQPTPTERLGIVGTGAVARGLARLAAPLIGEPLMWARRDASAVHVLSELGDDTRVTTDIEELAAAEIVVEAVAEDLEVKVPLLEQLHHLLPYDTLLMTTTSSLSVQELARASGRPDRFAGLHVFTPVHRMPLIEVIFPEEASEDTRRRTLDLCDRLDKTAVVVPDIPDFVVNRLLFPFLFDAVRLLDIDGIGPEIVDKCVQLGASHPLGPLALLDFVGLDVAASIGDSIGAEVPERMQALIDEGRLGRKSGAGFYEY